MATLVDTNILLDITGPRSAWTDWSEQRLAAARIEGPVVINPIVYAEFAAGYSTPQDMDKDFDTRRIEREDLPWEAAFLAGKAYLSYRRAGGDKRSPLPDFYIGAHAAAKGYALLTRDLKRYRIYFPALTIISPES